jgi:hypothetical protein
MSYVNPISLEGQRRRWTRHDAHRFASPLPPKSFAARRLEQRQIEEQQAIAAGRDAFEQKLLELRWQLKGLKLNYELRRFQCKYSPSQPRVPAGNPDGGEWTTGSNGRALARENQTAEHGDDNNETNPPVLLVADRPKGHHYVNQSLYKSLPLSPETRKVFEEATTGPLNEPHGWSREHFQYNHAVKESLDKFMDTNKISPEGMTPDQARSFVEEVKASPDPRIRNFNMRLMLREFLRRPPRSFGGSD